MRTKKAIRKPISLKISIVIVLFVLLQSSVLFWVSSNQLREVLFAEKKEEVQAQMISLQETLQYLIAKKEFAQTQKTVLSLGASIDLKTAFLIDENNQVIASTRLAAKGQRIAGLVETAHAKQVLQQLSELKSSLKNIIWSSIDQQSLYAISPIVIGRTSDDSLRQDKIGALYLHINMSWVDQEVRQLLQLSFLPIVLMLLMTGFGIALYFHLSITRRIKSINNAASRFVETEYSSQLKLAGNDEITDLGQAFNTMAEQVKAQYGLLAVNQHRLAKTQEIAHLGSWELDVVNNVLTWSDEVYRIFGYKPQEFGATYEVFIESVHPEDRALVDKAYSSSMNEGKDEYEVEHRIIQKNSGEIRHVYEKCIHEKDANGNIIRSLGMVHDITDHKTIEELLRRSQKMEAIGNLTGGIAHDFNNLLAIVQGNLEILAHGLKTNEKLTKRVNAALSGVHRGADITKRLLQFSRPKLAGAEILSLNQSIADMEVLIAKSVMKKIAIKLILKEELWLCKLNEGEFQDALLNLIINARDAMPDGGSVLIETSNKCLDEGYVQLNPDVKAGEYVEVSVSDMGCGMTSKTLEHVFEPFFTTKEIGKGTGLGLSMVYGFIKRSHGHIKLYSEIAHGTTVDLYLPRVLPDQSPVLETGSNELIALPRGNERVLLVDDEEDLLELAQHFLSDLGYSVLTATNADEALDVLSLHKDKIDLLFSDIVMPGMDGFALATKVAELYPGLSMLFTSGFSDKAVRLNGLAKHNVKLLDKPYSKQELALQVRRVLDGRNGKDINL